MRLSAPRSFAAHFWLEVLIFTGGGLVALWWALGDHAVVGVAFLALVLPVVVLSQILIGATFAQSVFIGDDGISARTVAGRKLEMLWPEICEVQRFTLMSPRGPRACLRLIQSGVMRAIVATDRLRGFAELEEEITRRTSHARTGKPRWWEYVILFG